MTGICHVTFAFAASEAAAHGPQAVLSIQDPERLAAGRAQAHAAAGRPGRHVAGKRVR